MNTFWATLNLGIGSPIAISGILMLDPSNLRYPLYIMLCGLTIQAFSLIPMIIKKYSLKIDIVKKPE